MFHIRVGASISVSAGVCGVSNDWLELMRWSCKEFQAIAAVLHVVGVSELTNEPWVAGAYSRFAPSLSNGGDKIGNLGWATYFGPPKFANEMDFRGLISEGFRVEPVAGGHLIIFSASITDVLDDFPTFSQRRAALKARFRPDLFKVKFEPGDPRGDNRGLPGFPWPDPEP